MKKIFFALFVTVLLFCSIFSFEKDLVLSSKNQLISFSIEELSGVTFTVTGNEVKPANPIAYSKKSILEAEVTLNYTISTGATLKIGNNTIASGSKVRLVKNATNPKLYELSLKVVGADSTESVYILKVERATNTAKELRSFAFRAVDNTGISTDIIGTITDTKVTFSTPIPADLRKLVAHFTVSEGARVRIGSSTYQTSGVTQNDFTGKVVYEVVSESNSTKRYTVNTEKVISEELSVTNNGATMKVQMHGNTKSKKLLLAVHGGPGGNSHSYHFSKNFRDNIETKYVAAYWDQRGCGMSVDGGGATNAALKIANNVADMDAVVGELISKYPTYQIFIYSSSWGGMITPAFLADGSNKAAIAGWIGAEGNHNTPLSRQLQKAMLIREAAIEIAAGRDSDEDGDGKLDWASWKEFAQNLDLSDLDIAKVFAFYEIGQAASDKKIRALINAGTITPEPRDTEYSHASLHSDVSDNNKYDYSPNVFQAMIPEVVRASYKNKLNQITTPVRIFYGKWDFLTAKGMADEVYNEIGSSDKQKIEFEKSGHGVSGNEPAKFVTELIKFIDNL